MIFPQIDPVIFSLGPIQLRWYSLMYVFGLIATYYYFRRSSKLGSLKLNDAQIENVMLYSLIGMILGARLTYVFVYNFSHYIENPMEIIATWKGGLSFHGAIIGIGIAVIIFSRKFEKSFFNIMDHMVTIAPVGLGFGRIGNFINGELWGRVTDAPIGVIFPDGGPLPRHPSQLYESLFEGWILLGIMLIIRKSNPKPGVSSALFLIFYATFRFFIEFFREPDSQLGTVLGPFSMGQLLCAIMWVIGGAILAWSLNQPSAERRAS
ncbi:MAG: prolipoprotein diacylglyceryl transferase [Proteobacteria bacterium]|nr:prolipoprotein diacylglyceryl transferase [Pseudomonadota bacterium]